MIAQTEKDKTSNAVLIENMPFDEYAALDAMNFSSLNKIISCPADFLQKDESQTASMEMGSLIHMACLEPAEYVDRYAVLPDLTEGIMTKDGEPAKNPRATAEYKARVAAWEAENPGKTPIEQAKHSLVMNCMQSWLKTLATLEIKPVARELVIVWDWCDMKWKARIDMIGEQFGRHVIVDLKCPGDTNQFRRTWMQRGYHRQMAVYRQAALAAGYDVAAVHIIAIEQDSGNHAHTLHAPMSSRSMMVGEVEMVNAMAKLRDCQEFGFEGYRSPSEWDLPQNYSAYVGETIFSEE